MHGPPGQGWQGADDGSDEDMAVPENPGQDWVVGEFLGPLDGVVQRVETVVFQGWPPQHRHGPDA